MRASYSGRLDHTVIALLSLILILLSVTTFWANTQARGDAPPPPGQLVDVGGWKLHLNCTGSNKDGSPTVVFEAGAGGISLDWYFVQASVTEFTRACSYDRAGTAWSELGPRPRTIRQDEYELHKLLANANIPGSYVLVGHSMGGLMVRNFQRQFPEEVSGMVLVDPASDDTRLVHFDKLMRLREDTTGKPIPPIRTTILPAEKQLSEVERPQTAQMVRVAPPVAPQDQRGVQPIQQGPPPHLGHALPPDIDRLRNWAMQQPGRGIDGSPFTGQEFAELYEARKAQQHVLGNMPLIVLIARQREEASNLRPDWFVSNEEVNRQDEELASMSVIGRFIYAENSGHNIPTDEPQIVVDAIRTLLEILGGKHHNQGRASKSTMQPRYRYVVYPKNLVAFDF